MAKSLKISWDEVISLLEKTYNIKNIQIMIDIGTEGCNLRTLSTKIDYIEGDL